MFKLVLRQGEIRPAIRQIIFCVTASVAPLFRVCNGLTFQKPNVCKGCYDVTGPAGGEAAGRVDGWNPEASDRGGQLRLSEPSCSVEQLWLPGAFL
jgi:hypothetical protein